MKESQNRTSNVSQWERPGERRERLKRRDALEHRQRILQVARELFTAQGVENVSMHQIALTAGLGQGTLYRCYAHKGDLCLDLLQASHEQFMGRLEAFLHEAEALPALERLRGLLERLIGFLENESALLGPIAQAGVPSGQEGRLTCGDEQLPSDPLSLLHSLCTDLLNEAIISGEIAPLDVTLTVDALFATLCPMSYRFQRQERGFTPERILAGISRLFIDGIRSSGPVEQGER